MGNRGIEYDGSQYTPEQREFMVAMDRYKRSNRRPFPTWKEVLDVLVSLGWRRVAEPADLPRPNLRLTEVGGGPSEGEGQNRSL